MPSDSDYAAAVGLVVAILLAAAAAPCAVGGYWACDGALYEITQNGRVLHISSAGSTTKGRSSWLRRVEAGGRTGRVSLFGRRIRWADGSVWIQQGV